MFTSNDFKALPTEYWFHLFAAYLAGNWTEFEKSCKEYDINVEYALFVCRLGDKVIPRRKDEE